jgi:hypothetical protein
MRLMKILASILILFFILGFISCWKSIESQTNTQQRISRNSDEYILEISSDFQGLWWMNGRILDFRLFEDGTFEYDEYPLQGTNLKAEEVKITKQSKISEAELKEILDLMMSTEFLKVKDKIMQEKGCTDAFIDTKISFNQGGKTKTILLDRHCATLANSSSTSFYYKDFPPILNRLFQLLQKIKSKESSGKFYN